MLNLFQVSAGGLRGKHDRISSEYGSRLGDKQFRQSKTGWKGRTQGSPAFRGRKYNMTYGYGLSPSREVGAKSTVKRVLDCSENQVVASRPVPTIVRHFLVSRVRVKRCHIAMHRGRSWTRARIFSDLTFDYLIRIDHRLTGRIEPTYGARAGC